MGIATAEIEARSLFGWWRDAGLEWLVQDAPAPWLTGPAPARAAQRTIAADLPPAFPSDLAALHEWLLDSDALAHVGPRTRRLAPEGAPGNLVVLTDMPELADIDAGQLLSGAIGKKFNDMLNAVQLSREEIYIVSLLPGRTPSGRLSAAQAEQAAALTRHHLALARPSRLWLLGDAAARAVIGKPTAQLHAVVSQVEVAGNLVPSIATAHPRLVADSRDHARRTWETMQLLFTEGRA